MLFLAFNALLFFASLVLILFGFMNFALFTTLPLGLEVLIVLGFVTPVMNIYDTIRNFIFLFSKYEE